MSVLAFLLIFLIVVSRVAGRKAGGDSFTAGVIFFFAFLALLMLGIVLERSLGYLDPLVTVRRVLAFTLLGESLLDLGLSVLRYARTRQPKYVGYALLFLLFFSFLVAALIGDLPVGALD